jgi:ABC-type branched-subunit amino acid transport system substrate-binding protein
MFGPSCELCAQLAAEELNADGGVLGREVRLRAVDGSRPPRRVAHEVGRLVDDGAVDAVVGWHISAVRQALAPRVAGRVPYVYTALYEGGERTPGVFLTGETPVRQLRPAMGWFAREHGAQRWCIVGDDYVWPHRTAAMARGYAAGLGGSVCHEEYVPLGSHDFEAAVKRVDECRPDAVLILLVGQDAVEFNRAFGRAGLDVECRRLSTLTDENMVLATGAANARGLCTTAGFFEALSTPESRDFVARYSRRFGPGAPTLNSLGESCYEGIVLLAALAHAARGLDVRRMCLLSDGVAYAGPRGEVRLGRDRHVDQRMYLATADGLGLTVLDELQAPDG